MYNLGERVTKMSDKTMTNLNDFLNDIRTLEGELATGSETCIWGDCIHRLNEVVGYNVLSADDTVEIPIDEARWWLSAYKKLSDPNEDINDLQSDIYDRIV